MTVLRVRLDPEDRAVLEKAAKLCRQTLADYTRGVLLRDARRVVADGAASREESKR